jgi:aminoglycoside phosphotransferase (APT) family kinase protein
MRRVNRSQTQRQFRADEVENLLTGALGPGRRASEAVELTGGGFAAVWRARLSDGQDVVLKTAPPLDAVLLCYESGLLRVEADYFRRVRREAAAVPMPEVLHLDPQHTWMATTCLPGTPLSQLPGAGAATVRHELGQALARLHALDGPEFGYQGPGRRRGPSWRAVFLDIIDDLLADAARLGAELPRPAEEIRSILGPASAVLDQVRKPALVHFDLWDGNVLAAPDPSGTLRLTGLVDGERSLHADPLIDFVSANLFGAIEDEPKHPLVLGYGQALGRPLLWDAPARARIQLYRAWLYLVMNVEIPTRALTGDANLERRRHRAQLLTDALAGIR